MSHLKITCVCGCRQEAKWLASGQDYTPPGSNNRTPSLYSDEPMCDASAQYCEEAARELGLPFAKKLIT